MQRRPVLAGLALILAPQRLRAAGGDAQAVTVEGEVLLEVPGTTPIPVMPGQRLPAGSRIVTGPGARAELALADGSRLHAGGSTGIGLPGPARGSLNISGLAVLDRRAVPGSFTVDTRGFEVVLADARVFIDSVSAGTVFVRDGAAEVVTPQIRLALVAGQGIDLPAPPRAPGGGVPSAAAPGALPAPLPAPAPLPPPVPQDWSGARIEAAFASVGLVT